MNKKLSRMLESNLRFYFLCLLAFSIAAFPFNPMLALTEGCITILLFLWNRNSSQKRKKSILQYIDNLTGSVDSANKSTLANSPLPMMVFRPESGEVVWSNEHFMALSGVKEQLFDMRVDDAAPDFSAQWLLEGKSVSPNRVTMNGRQYQVYGNLVRTKDRQSHMVATTYWVDTTDGDQALSQYQMSRPVICILMLDNYDELMKTIPDAQHSALLAQIDEKVNAWVSGTNGMLLKITRDKQLFLFEEQQYEAFVQEKFSLLDAIRDIKSFEGVAPTISIGIGKDFATMAELYRHATLSLEMALSRGGDQAVVRNKVDFAFYGGRAKATEKRTKVKSRVMANALSELIVDAKQVYVMGHAFADMDALGAAAGICCAARKRNKAAFIVMDPERNACKELIERLKECPEYENVFIGAHDAFLRIQPNSLVVVVDTSRPDMVENPDLLGCAGRIAVIDHHRRGALYIDNAALNFHEPYASSAAELVTELLQYLVEPSDVLRAESEALLAGIVLDTKKFTLRTGGRTFDAAAFLRRAGADTTEVQRFFQSELDEMVNRYGIIREAELYRGDIAMAVIEEAGVDRITAAKAADEMLSLRGVRAAFVAYPMEQSILISARSLGEVNVQVVLEVLGGGGNSTTAGAKIDDMGILQVKQELMDAVDRYLEN
ncbi:DHH family phosphoesterase [Bengtsoniella intestinalis]|uniref:DHH family phosphoesterase n=1 Tax=Bengtsoniella intestinalis TaxID=3073143 RepID=UPI00391F9103